MRASSLRGSGEPHPHPRSCYKLIWSESDVEQALGECQGIRGQRAGSVDGEIIHSVHLHHKIGKCIPWIYLRVVKDLRRGLRDLDKNTDPPALRPQGLILRPHRNQEDFP